MQAKFKLEQDSHLVDTSGNHFVNGRCINPKVGEGEISDTHNIIPKGATQSGVVITGRITEPVSFIDEFKRKFTIEP